jgi:hypoxia up-regulated 1
MFPSLKGLLGRPIESDVVKRFLREHPSIQTTQGDRSSLTFKVGESTYTVEELVAMQLVNIKLQAEKMADETIKDLILTVPVYSTEHERKALINAAELAGMKVSSLLNDGLAGIPTVGDLIDKSGD